MYTIIIIYNKLINVYYKETDIQYIIIYSPIICISYQIWDICPRSRHTPTIKVNLTISRTLKANKAFKIIL